MTWRAGLGEDEQCYAADPLEKNADSRKGWVALSDSTNWRIDLSRRGFRLPTESEWERVCRSGIGASYSFGDDRRWLAKYGWYHENAGNGLYAAGLLRPNPRGLFDMHGNVFEWCQDWYGSWSQREEDPVHDESGSLRVARGGSWTSLARNCRSGIRVSSRPALRGRDLGFRLAAVPSTEPSKQVVGSRGGSNANVFNAKAPRR